MTSRYHLRRARIACRSTGNRRDCGPDTLLIGGPTWGYFNGTPYTAAARGNKMLLHIPRFWPNDDAVVTIFPDSLTMTTGIRTLLHEGDTLRVFKR